MPLIIAVNKCDLPDANPQRVLEELVEHGVVVEALGGDVQSVNISALTGMNIGELEAAVGALAGTLSSYLLYWYKGANTGANWRRRLGCWQRLWS